MRITLKLSAEQECQLWAAAAQQDAQAVREILLQAVDAAVEDLLAGSAQRTQAQRLPALLDEIAAGFRDAPVLSDEAVSRAGIYSDDL